MNASSIDSEHFRVDYRRAPFVALFAAAGITLLAGISQLGLASLVVALPPLALAVAIGWYFGTLEIGPQGLVLYRTHRVKWSESAKVKYVLILDLPHLRVWRTAGLPWLVPLYVLGPRPVLQSLENWAPTDGQVAQLQFAVIWQSMATPQAPWSSGTEQRGKAPPSMSLTLKTMSLS